MLSRTIIENLLLLFGESFWVVSIYAQLAKLIKTKNKHGLSSVTMTLDSVANVAWMVYFGTRHVWVGLVSNTLMFIMTVAILLLLLSNKKERTRGILSIVLLTPLTTYILLTNSDISGWLGLLYNVIAATPWLIHVIRVKKTSGISEGALYFGLFATLSSLSYGIMTKSGPLAVGSVIGLIYEFIIMSYYYRYRHHT